MTADLWDILYILILQKKSLKYIYSDFTEETPFPQRYNVKYYKRKSLMKMVLFSTIHLFVIYYVKYK